jgi:glycosyltransferase involved in cell wall biosynthesis
MEPKTDKHRTEPSAERKADKRTEPSAAQKTGEHHTEPSAAPKLPVSVFILTLDEEDRLPRCLRSLSWAEDVVVIDSGSTDGTVAVARSLGARVVHHDWEGYSRQKDFALTQCEKEWVIWLDADEEISDELAKSLREALRSPQRADGYEVARRTIYLGKPLRFGGWYPDWKVRIFRRNRVRFDGLSVHESAVVRGRVERLKGDLLHHSYRNLSHHLEKIDTYSTLSAREMNTRRTPKPWDLLVHPPAKFIKAYILRLGFLEGWRGLVVALMGALYVAMKYAKLYELQGKEDS